MRNLNLENFLYKNVVVTGTDGKVYRGKVTDWTSAEDNADLEDDLPEEESIDVDPPDPDRDGWWLFESDIADIRLDEQA